jgi:hypothetical protein
VPQYSTHGVHMGRPSEMAHRNTACRVAPIGIISRIYGGMFFLFSPQLYAGFTLSHHHPCSVDQIRDSPRANLGSWSQECHVLCQEYTQLAKQEMHSNKWSSGNSCFGNHHISDALEVCVFDSVAIE